MFLAVGSKTSDLSDVELRRHLNEFLTALGERDEVLLVPPDFSRFSSQAGKITQMICEYYQFIPCHLEEEPEQQQQQEKKPTAPKKDDDDDKNTLPPPLPKVPRPVPKIEILPALGTHAPMTIEEIRKMYGDELAKTKLDCFLVHDWRNDVVTIGQVSAELVRKATYGTFNESWPVQLNEKVWDKRIDKNNNNKKKEKKPLVLSIGQVVPHEVMGMSNYNKNLFVGTGGMEAINLSHFIGAIHGMERMMGRKNNPLRNILNQASQEFLEPELDLWYILTVVSPETTTATPTLSSTSSSSNKLCLRGLYIGRDVQCYSQACDLSLQVNFTLLDRPIHRCVVYLDPNEFHSTWLGNKAIYRTRMAMADGGRLFVLAPGVTKFGEDDQVDQLIRRYGYKGTQYTLQQMKEQVELRNNLSVVAHLIHGSSEGRFHITYCTFVVVGNEDEDDHDNDNNDHQPLTRQEIENVGFDFADLTQMLQRYNLDSLSDGWNVDDEGEFYFIRKPALGLWAIPSHFEEDPPTST